MGITQRQRLLNAEIAAEEAEAALDHERELANAALRAQGELQLEVERLKAWLATEREQHANTHRCYVQANHERNAALSARDEAEGANILNRNALKHAQAERQRLIDAVVAARNFVHIHGGKDRPFYNDLQQLLDDVGQPSHPKKRDPDIDG